MTVEDGVFIGPGAILTNDRYPRAITSTGDLARADDWTVSPITLREGCSIGAGAVVVAGVDVGPFAMVGAGAVVTRTVPDTRSSPATRPGGIGWVCACGAPARRRRRATPRRPTRDRYAVDKELICVGCGRTYTYVPDAEALEERSRPGRQQGAPA